MPLPVKVAFCGEPPPLSLMETLAVNFPLTFGVNVTLIAQLLPAPSEAVQVVVWPKSPALAPVTEIPEMVTATLPWLVTVTTCGLLVDPTG